MPVSIDFGAGRMPTLLLLIRRAGCPLYCYSFFSRFPIPHSRFPTPQNHKTPQRHNLAGLHDILFGGGRRI
ncbi:MAG: hypothetical protein F6K50_40375 [Moorea sp. SIO3I7]|nr:hypothetical protein [Moorena sp. SIO3I7]